MKHQSRQENLIYLIVWAALRSPAIESVCAYRQRPYAYFRLDGGVSGVAEICGIPATVCPSQCISGAFTRASAETYALFLHRGCGLGGIYNLSV